MSVTEGAALEQPKASNVWLWVLAVICVGLLGHGIAKQQDTLGNLAYSIGYWVIPTLVITLLFNAVFKASRDFRWKIFGVLYICAIVGSNIGYRIQQQEAGVMMSSLKESMTSFAEQTNVGDPKALPQRIELQPVTAKASGDLGVVELVSKQLLNDMANAHNEYLAALEGAGWMSLLDAERLKSDTHMQESLRIIQRSEQVMKAHRQKAFAIIESIPDRAQQAPFRSETARRQFLKGLDVGLVKGRENAEISWGYEAQIIQEYKGIIELLARRWAHFEFDAENNVLFESQSDADDYNARMARVDEITKKQAEAAQKAQNAALQKFDATQ